MRILFFGRLGDRIGRDAEIELPADVRNVADLRRLLATLKPEVGDEFLGRGLRASVGDAVVNDDHPIDAQSEVAFFPPLSGG